MRKFRHEDANERPMTPPVRKYEDVETTGCDTRLVRIAELTTLPHRLTLSEAGHAVMDERVYALGIESCDIECPHIARLEDRYGHGRCLLCRAHLWCASWVADGVFGNDTLRWADEETVRVNARLVRPVASIR